MIDRFIDAHCLAGVDDWLSKNKTELAHRNFLDEYYEEAVQEVREFRSLIMPFPSSENGSFIKENAMIEQLHRQFPWTEPVYAFNYKSEENFADLCQRLEKGSAGGLVVWPIVCDLDLFDLAENEKFLYLISKYPCWFTIHVGAGNEAAIHRVSSLRRYCPEDAICLAEAFPHVKFNLSHLLRISGKALEKAEKLDNIIIDISGISTHLRWYEYGKNVFPADDAGDLAEMESAKVIHTLMNRPGLCNKLVFGTQYPFGKWYGFGLGRELEMIRKADLTKEKQEKLLYLNFETFFQKGDR